MLIAHAPLLCTAFFDHYPNFLRSYQEGNMGIDIYVKNGKEYIYFEGKVGFL